jgi:tetratricopeptide (TPR) repeat protein
MAVPKTSAEFMRRFQSACALAAEGRSEQAITEFEQLVQAVPNMPTIWLNKGIAEARAGRYEEGLKSLNQCLELDPSMIGACVEMAACRMGLGQHQEAITWCDRVLTQEPANVEAIANKAIALGKLGKNNEALKCWDQAIQVRPNDPKLWANKGIRWLNIGRHNQAMTCFDKALEIDPHCSLAIRGREQCFTWDPRGEWDEDRQVWVLAEKPAPKCIVLRSDPPEVQRRDLQKWMANIARYQSYWNNPKSHETSGPVYLRAWCAKCGERHIHNVTADGDITHCPNCRTRIDLRPEGKFGGDYEPAGSKSRESSGDAQGSG